MGATIQGKADTSFLGSSLETALQSPATEGALEAVKQLVDDFSGQVWIVSKCGPSVQRKTRAWLDHHDFSHHTGWSSENLRFCLKRPEKAAICAELGITHFVDDRLDVLEAMSGVVPYRYLFGEQEPGLHWSDIILHVPDWKAVLREVRIQDESLRN